MAANGSGANAATPLSPPSNTVLLNLSDYMYEAYDTAYASTPLNNNPDIGFTPLLKHSGAPVVSIDDSTGLYAQAFVSTAPGPKQVVIAYEGTQLTPFPGTQDPNVFAQGPLFTPAQIVDDLQLYAGQRADSFTGSASFARDVIGIAANQGIKRHNIYTTGHSLGAAEAAFAAAKTGLSGITFASPGINTKFTGRGGANVTNYVDAGDPIGNYAADGLNTLAPVLTSDKIKHYGNVVVLPNETGLTGLQNDAALYASGSPLFQALALKNALGEDPDQNGQYHHISRYAADLDVTLYLPDQTTNSQTGFFPVSAYGSSNSASQASIDSSYIAAAMTSGGMTQSASASSSASHASVLTASNDTHPGHAMGVRHHAG